MFCSRCGANNADTARVCVQCGQSFQPAQLSSTPLPVQGAVLPPGTTVPNYLVFAILSTVFCCLPSGIAAIVYAAQVNGKLQAGDVAGAQAASRNAKLWCLISLGLGLGLMLLWVMLMMAGILAHRH